MSQLPSSAIVEKLADALKVDENNTSLPTLQIIVQEIFGAFGGVKGFVEDMVNCYRTAKAGSQVQARLAECMIDLVKVAHDRQLLGSSVGETEALDDAELEAEIKRASERAVKSVMEAEHERA